MAAVRQGSAVTMSLTPGTAALYDRPVLVVDPAMHIGAIRRGAADRDGNWAVTCGDDKTVRVWSLSDGALSRTIRLPVGPGNIGKANAVAITPDGALIAAGGWTRWTDADPVEQIYLFDRSSGLLIRRIDDLFGSIGDLAFSPDGAVLAVITGGGRVELRLYASNRDWGFVASDSGYDGPGRRVTFGPGGQAATVASDGKVRLYDANLREPIKPSIAIDLPAGHQPNDIAFSPDGMCLAVGYQNRMAVTLLDGHTLAQTGEPDVKDIAGGILATVAWSMDGRTLFAGGTCRIHDGVHSPIVAWSEAGAGKPRILPAAQMTMTSLKLLPNGDLLAAAADPWLGRLRPDGTPIWVRGPMQAHFFDQPDRLLVSSSGARISFNFAANGTLPAMFDLAAPALKLGPPDDGCVATPRRDGLPIEGWRNTSRPTLPGRPLALNNFENSRSCAVHPADDRFVIGADWSLRAFDVGGTPLWTKQVPEAVWAVNITSDGRLVVAAFHDGTIRWHRMSDGVELLAFMPLPDRTNWVAWTPEGFYAATPARMASCVGTSIAAGTPRRTPCRSPTSRAFTALTPCRSCCRNWRRSERLDERTWPSKGSGWRSAPTARCRPARSFTC
jgi:WD40 repeat protein